MNCYRKCTMIDWPNRKIMYKWYLHRSVPGSRIIESIIRWTASTIRFQGCSKQTKGCHQYVKSITVYQFVCINIKSHLSIIWLFDACLQMTIDRIVYAFWVVNLSYFTNLLHAWNKSIKYVKTAMCRIF